MGRLVKSGAHFQKIPLVPFGEPRRPGFFPKGRQAPPLFLRSATFLARMGDFWRRFQIGPTTARSAGRKSAPCLYVRY